MQPNNDDEWDPWDVVIPMTVGTILFILVMAAKSCGIAP
jgi:hypothetical protein